MNIFFVFVSVLLFLLYVTKADEIDDYFCRPRLGKICKKHGQNKHVACRHSKVSNFLKQVRPLVNFKQNINMKL